MSRYLSRALTGLVLMMGLFVSHAGAAEYGWRSSVSHPGGLLDVNFTTRERSCAAMGRELAAALNGLRFDQDYGPVVTAGEFGFWTPTGECDSNVADVPVTGGTYVVVSFMYPEVAGRWGGYLASSSNVTTYLDRAIEVAEEADEAVVLAMFAAGFVPTLILYFTAWSIGLVIRAARGG